MDCLSVLREPSLLQRGIARCRNYRAGEAVFEEGSPGRSLYLIESGCVRISGRVELDAERRFRPGLCDLQAGEIFGELSLFEAAPRSASAVAVADCALLEFDCESFSAWLDEHPQLGYVMLKSLFAIITGRLRQADKRLESVFAWGLKAHAIDRHL